MRYLLLSLILFTTPAVAQPVTDDAVAAAISHGAASKGKTFPGLIAFERHMMGMGHGFMVRIYTPLTWIEQEAAQAAIVYKPLSLDTVTPEMRTPVLRVVAPPLLRQMNNSASVQALVLKDETRQRIIQPLNSEPYTTETGNAMGAKLSLTGLSLTFPLEVLDELTKGKEFYVALVDSDGAEHEIRIKRGDYPRLKR